MFNAAMSSGSAERLPAILAAYDFSQFMCLVDVGGGHGGLLAGILSASPKTRGVLYDLPNVVAGADALHAPDSAERCEIVGGDFFQTVPGGGDAYLLSRVIHDWDDAPASTILETAGAEWRLTLGCFSSRGYRSRQTNQTRTNFSMYGSSVAVDASGLRRNTEYFSTAPDLRWRAS